MIQVASVGVWFIICWLTLVKVSGVTDFCCLKAILFDFDGTLADTLGMYIKAYRKTLEHYGFKFTDEEIVQITI